MELVARPVDLSHPLKPAYVMGLQLVEVTDELRMARGFPDRVHVMILDPGPNHERFQVGRLRPGYGIWFVGPESGTEVRSVSQLVERMLEVWDVWAADRQRDPWGPHLRLVYTFPHGGGTNTQHMILREEDVAALRRAQARLR